MIDLGLSFTKNMPATEIHPLINYSLSRLLEKRTSGGVKFLRA